jgi:hypothetical protein
VSDGVPPSAPPKVICAWCPEYVPPKRGEPPVSHGMCAACAKRWNAQLEEESNDAK